MWAILTVCGHSGNRGYPSLSEMLGLHGASSPHACLYPYLGTCEETKVRLEKLLFYPKEFVCVHEALKAFSKSKALTSANAIFYQPGE